MVKLYAPDWEIPDGEVKSRIRYVLFRRLPFATWEDELRSLSSGVRNLATYVIRNEMLDGGFSSVGVRVEDAFCPLPLLATWERDDCGDDSDS